LKSGRTKNRSELELVCEFAPGAPQSHANSHADNVSPNRSQEAAKYWSQFWMTGGAIDLSGSKDPRWFELERRIVLSQYLTAIQDAGSPSAAGNRPDVQHLGRQISSRNALVA
jgi:hypothetical protein